MGDAADSRAFFIVLPPRSAARPEVAEFSRWLQEQARAEDADALSADPARETRAGQSGK